MIINSKSARLTGKFLNDLTSDQAIKIICWEVSQNNIIDGSLIYMARWLLYSDKVSPGCLNYDLVSALSNFSGDIDDLEDLKSLSDITRPIVEEIMECPQ
jgi:hypothetical protein